MGVTTAQSVQGSLHTVGRGNLDSMDQLATARADFLTAQRDGRSSILYSAQKDIDPKIQSVKDNLGAADVGR